MEEPLPERRDVGVGASANMSVGAAASRVWTVRYCFDFVKALVERYRWYWR